MPGRLGLRWCVLSSTDINICALLGMETGVLVKYDRVKSFGTFPEPTTTWFREDTALGVEYTIAKNTDKPSRFTVLVKILPSCLVLFTKDQPLDEELLTEMETDSPIQLGMCDVDPVLGDMKAEFYATQDGALIDWPDAQIWVWD